jgi:hypothetical protein
MNIISTSMKEFFKKLIETVSKKLREDMPTEKKKLSIKLCRSSFYNGFLVSSAATLLIKLNERVERLLLPFPI